MYKISTADPQIIGAYVDDMAGKLKPAIADYLQGKELDVDLNGSIVKVAVENRSLTHRFLKSLSDIETLKKYLKMEVGGQYLLVRRLQNEKYSDDLIFKRLGVTTYKKYYKGNPPVIDHFNEIMHDIFVANGYDAFIDKLGFITNTRLRICPYCGIDKVIESKRTKNEIDHFLPKGKYPFFAVSYYNLIPSCNSCNRADHKGQLSPIDEKANGLVVLNPYIFNKSIVRFHLDIANLNVYEPDNFSVIVGFTDKAYLNGYDRFFDISDRYASCNEEASEDYTRLMDFKAEHFYEEMNVDKDWMNKAHRAMMGYSIDNNSPHLKERYLMRRNIFEQLNGLRKPAPYYTHASGDNTVILE